MKEDNICHLSFTKQRQQQETKEEEPPPKQAKIQQQQEDAIILKMCSSTLCIFHSTLYTLQLNCDKIRDTHHCQKQKKM
jgi:hypothetical protein